MADAAGFLMLAVLLKIASTFLHLLPVIWPDGQATFLRQEHASVDLHAVLRHEQTFW